MTELVREDPGLLGKDTRLVVWFEDLRMADRPRVGGKCASLGELISAGIPVPGGFAVTVAAFQAVLSQGAPHDGSGARLDARLAALVAGVDVGNQAALSQVQEQAVQLVCGAALPSDLERAIRESYAQLCRRAGGADLPVAVRSSAVAEDGEATSFAGQQETYLWVVGADAVLARVRDCWASLFTPQAVAYRSRLAPEQQELALAMAVGVQEMVDAHVAGVAFTVSPTTGDRSVVAVNASWGLGEAVVAGEVTPDEYWLSKVGPTLTRSRVARKERRCVPRADGQGTELVAVPDDMAAAPCLDAALLTELATLAVGVEKHYGTPQDIEWALAREPDGGHRFLVLQSRPETVTSRLAPPGPTAPTTSPASSYLSVLADLGAATRRSRP